MRKFATGAVRDDDESKIDPEGFLSPHVVRAFCEYMQEHQTQADGAKRSSDNWQRGIPLDAYMKSMWRHFLEVWALHRSPRDVSDAKREALCALMFNVQGYMHEVLKENI